MKLIKLITLLIFLFAINISAQSVRDLTNSTDAVLGSGATFTPAVWRLGTGYNSATITIKSDKNSASNGVKVKFATLVSGNYLVVDSLLYTYTAGTLFKVTVPITAPYLKVIYTNTTLVQTYFSLVTMLNVGQNLNFDSNGNLSVNGTVTVTDLTNGNQTTMLTGSPNRYGKWHTTTGTTVDSVVFGFTTRLVTFINDGLSTDTLMVSGIKTFLPSSTDITNRVGGEGFTYGWAVTKLYFKVGTTPLASKKIRIEGN